jgi:ankyrin repeat protein
MSFWKRLFGAKRQPRKILELRSDLAANLRHWESSGEAEAWVLAHLKGWNHQDWLDLLASLRKSAYWPMSEAAIGEHLEMLRAKLMATGVKESPITNLHRWESSGQAEAWVGTHPKGWNHQDWLDLLASLHESPYWPMDEAAIGKHLEMLRAKLMAMEVKESSNTNLHQWESSGQAEAWVRAHPKGWNHQDWLDLLASLKASSYWPMNEPALGQRLEQRRDRATAAASCRLTSPVPPTADVNEKDRQGQSALIRASGAGNRETVELLIAAGVQMNGKDNEGRTPLIMAAERGYADCVKALIAGGADLEAEGSGGFTALAIAVKNGHAGCAEALIASGAAVDAKAAAWEGKTPLHLAAESGRRDIGDLLLAKGARANLTDERGRTPLHLAALGDHQATAELLLAHQANANARATGGETPLHSAAQTGSKGVAKLLLANNAEVNASMGGQTALHFAADEYTAALLLANQADVNARSDAGGTPLHRAAQNGRSKVAIILIAYGAQVSARSNDGQTPLHMAAYEGHKDVAELLLANGAEVDAKTDDGRTPLYLAVRKRHRDVAELLLASKADVNLKNGLGRTPLHFASDNETANLLRQYGGHG